MSLIKVECLKEYPNDALERMISHLESEERDHQRQSKLARKQIVRIKKILREREGGFRFR